MTLIGFAVTFHIHVNQCDAILLVGNRFTKGQKQIMMSHVDHVVI